MKGYVTTIGDTVIMTVWTGPEEKPDKIFQLDLDISYPYWSEVVEFEEVRVEDDS